MTKLFRFEIPDEPIVPKLPKKPRALKKQEKAWEELKKTAFYESYSMEFCSYCCTLIGKDYGSFGHKCDEGELSGSYYKPQLEYERALRDWKRKRMEAIVGNALLDHGFELEHAAAIIKHGAGIEDIAQMLDISLDEYES